MRGKHPKIQSLWNHEDIAAQVGSYIRSNKFDITPKNLCEHVNGTILPNIGVDNEDKKISESTAARWLRRLGWKFGTYKKGLYFDASTTAFHKSVIGHDAVSINHASEN
ncbi:5798_t:CDS:2 [Entrophospora sp. SA101]|nr:5798_t:CDS:2 [Entrophospora sp. SA101]